MTTNHSLPVGTRLQSQTDTYTITEVLGAGGFGITYKATFPTRVRNIVTKASVAVKEHFPASDCERSATTSAITFSGAARERVTTSLRNFVDEAKYLQRIAGLHPNIVRVNEVFQANNTAYYVMEYIEGRTLKDYVITNGPLSLRETLSIIMPIIEAVATLHVNRFTHLDIKPSNIMLATGDDGALRPVLIDFGLAKHYNADGSATATIGMSGVSEGYAPIEQYTGVTTFSPQIDVYALGATILFCLTGKTPPKAIEIASPDALMALFPTNLPQDVRNLLSRAMAFQSHDRFADSRQLYQALLPVANAAGVNLNAAGINAVDIPDSAAGSDDTQMLNPGGGFAAPVADNDRTIISSSPAASLAATPRPNNDIRIHPNPSYPEPQERTGAPIWIWVVIALLVAALAVAGFLVYETLSDKDIHAPVLQEDSRDQDISTVKDTYDDNDKPSTFKSDNDTPLRDGESTPDLSFHDLTGPVKSCKNQWGAVLPYDRDGNWTGNYTDDLGPRTFSRDSKGRIVRESYNSSQYGPGDIEYTWDGNLIESMVDNTRGQSVYYTYRSDGSVSSQTAYNNGKSIRYDFSNEHRDSHGNWTSRSFRREATDADGRTTTSSGTQRRTISYYSN